MHKLRCDHVMHLVTRFLETDPYPRTVRLSATLFSFHGESASEDLGKLMGFPHIGAVQRWRTPTETAQQRTPDPVFVACGEKILPDWSCESLRAQPCIIDGEVVARGLRRGTLLRNDRTQWHSTRSRPS
jgi:hypothetical protein